MALMGGKEKENIIVALTGMNTQTVYVKTNKFEKAVDLINYYSSYAIELKLQNSDNERIVAYTPGYFISGQIMHESTVSVAHNKIWEIV